MPCTVIVGGFFGDEGKGKIAAYLAMKDKPDICVRGGNGPNAGHTVIHDGVQYSLRLIPSGFVNRSTRLLIGPGVPVDPIVLLDELRKTDSERRIEVDNQCAIVEPRHKEQESRSDHLSRKVGSTKSGVGACNAERALRMAKMAQTIPSLKPYVGDTVGEIQKALAENKKIMIEGTQGTFLSLYHGTYPYIFKAYMTRVGEGPLDGQLDRDEVARRGWTEFGTVTGRERRAAPFDFKLAKRAVQLNGATQIALTKLDVLFPSAKGVRHLEDLDKPARAFISNIEKETGVKVTLIGTGPGEEDLIDLRAIASSPRLRTAPIVRQN